MKTKIVIITFLVALIHNATAQTNSETYVTAKVSGKEGIINAKGEWVINPIYDHVDRKTFGPNGLAAVQLDGKYGYIDKNGKTVIEQQFDYASSFAENGLARIKANDGKWGYIDKTGKMIINPQYEWAGDFGKNGLAEVRLDGKSCYINKKGKIIADAAPNEATKTATDELTPTEQDGKYGYVDQSGKMVITLPSNLETYSTFGENGLAKVSLVERDGNVTLHLKDGFIDRTGIIVIEPQFDAAFGFYSNGLAKVKIDRLWGCIDETGKIVIPAQYSSINIVNNIIFVQQLRKWGIVDKNGNTIIAPTFDEVNDNEIN